MIEPDTVPPPESDTCSPEANDEGLKRCPYRRNAGTPPDYDSPTRKIYRRSSLDYWSVLEDGFMHVEFGSRAVAFDGRSLALEPPDYNVLCLLVQRPGELVPIDEINAVVRCGIDEAIREGAEGERLEAYLELRDFHGRWFLICGRLCKKLGFTFGNSPIRLHRSRGEARPRP